MEPGLERASELPLLIREPAGEPEGGLVLLHGRGTSEADLHPLLDALDPERRLLGVTPGGRPEDKSALGYTMLLRYPQIKGDAFYGPASDQLIQAVRILACDAGAEVYAVSRPGGLATYLTRAV